MFLLSFRTKNIILLSRLTQCILVNKIILSVHVYVYYEAIFQKHRMKKEGS